MGLSLPASRFRGVEDIAYIAHVDIGPCTMRSRRLGSRRLHHTCHERYKP
jgi:hypothetical protein